MRAVDLVVISALALSGCAANKVPSPQQCATIFAEASQLTLAIADIATTDEEMIQKVQRATAIAELAGTLGCPIVIPMLIVDE